MPVEASLLILKGLHQRWTYLLKSMSLEDFQKTFFHPERGKISSLEETLSLYAWHCKHHLAHITTLKKTKQWK
jgi:hypothetical protein